MENAEVTEERFLFYFLKLFDINYTYIYIYISRSEFLVFLRGQGNIGNTFICNFFIRLPFFFLM